MLLLVSLTEERAIYLALELDRSWTEMTGVNPLDGTIFLCTPFRCTTKADARPDLWPYGKLASSRMKLNARRVRDAFYSAESAALAPCRMWRTFTIWLRLSTA